MANWQSLYSEARDGWNETIAREQAAKRWLTVHKWIFLPLAFVVGFVIGTFA